MVRHEIQLYLAGQQAQAAEPVAFRSYIAQVRHGVSEQAHEGFFREMLGDIDEPTLPFGLQDVQGDGQGIDEARMPVDADLSRRLRSLARPLGVSVAKHDGTWRWPGYWAWSRAVKPWCSVP